MNHGYHSNHKNHSPDIFIHCLNYDSGDLFD